jgi:hypothetical protein
MATQKNGQKFVLPPVSHLMPHSLLICFVLLEFGGLVLTFGTSSWWPELRVLRLEFRAYSLSHSTSLFL